MYSLVTFPRGCVNFVYTNSTISDLRGEIIEQFSNKRKKSRFDYCRSCKNALHSSFFPSLMSSFSNLLLSRIPCLILFLNPLSSLTPLQWSIEMFHYDIILTYPALPFHLLYWQLYFVFNIDHNCILLYYHLFIVQSILIHSVLDWLISFIVLLWLISSYVQLDFQPSLIVSLNFFLAASPSFHSSILHSILALVFTIVLSSLHSY